MSKKIPITNLHHLTDWSATQSENSSIRFDFSSKIHSARAAQTAWQNRSERCWKMDDQRPSNAWTRFALGDLGGISSRPKIITVFQDFPANVHCNNSLPSSPHHRAPYRSHSRVFEFRCDFNISDLESLSRWGAFFFTFLFVHCCYDFHSYYFRLSLSQPGLGCKFLRH